MIVHDRQRHSKRPKVLFSNILWWFYIQSNITLLGAQQNVVLEEGLFPRSLVDSLEMFADHRVCSSLTHASAPIIPPSRT